MSDVTVNEIAYEVTSNDVDHNVAINQITYEVKVTNDVAIGIKGDKGDKGDQGPPGITPYTYAQSVASTTWTINHNLGFNPSVDLISEGGVEMEAEIVYTSINQVVVNFNTAVKGTARLI